MDNQHRHCRHCQAAYVPAKRSQRYCAVACRDAARAQRRREANARQNGGQRRHCVCCEAAFVPRMKSHRFCSAACREAARNQRRRRDAKQRQCDHCGAAYTPAKRHQTYCGAACRIAAKGERQRANERAQRRAEGTPPDHVRRRCRVCLQWFTSKRYNAMYCGSSCKTHALNRRRNQRRRKSDREFIPSPKFVAKLTAGIRQTWSDEERTQRKADCSDLAEAIIESRQHEGGDDE